MNAKPKLHIFYRHVHIKADKLSRDPNKSRPPWFSHENCFRNLLETIKSDVSGNNVNLTVMYDGTIEDLQEEPFAGRLIGFKGSALDYFINRVKKLRMKKFYPTPKDLNRLLVSQGLTIEGLITEFYNLYQQSSNGMTVQPYHPR